jgi:hypothetical protein
MATPENIDAPESQSLINPEKQAGAAVHPVAK